MINFKRLLKLFLPIQTVNYLKRFLIYFPFEKADTDIGKILQFKHYHDKHSSMLCLFSHFDKDDIIDDYVVFYIKSLYELGFDIIFISTSERLSLKEFKKVELYCRDVIVKENIGYDFGAWAMGMNYLSDEVDTYDSLLLCNDSVYAPLYPLDEMFKKMEGKYDFWGITDSYEIYHHLQSYFMVFNKKIIRNQKFRDIWNEYKVYKIKRNIILQYEIGLSQKLIKSGYVLGSYCSYNKLFNNNIVNSSHYKWKELIENLKCPVIKVELLRDNPKNIDISRWKYVIEKKTDYNKNLICHHLKRMESNY